MEENEKADDEDDGLVMVSQRKRDGLTSYLWVT